MKMFLEISLLVIAIAILIYLFFSFAGVLLAPGYQIGEQGSVCFGERCFEVELAKTQAQKDRGLMQVNHLDADKGMLFIFDKEGIYPFWMKNTLVPLDIIWIDSNGSVVHLGQNLQPCKSLICPSVVPSAKAKYVLEINAGLCKEIGLNLGDSVTISGIHPGLNR